MKGYTHLLMRELSQRKNLWWAALAAGFIPMLLQVLPGIHYAPAEIRDASALAISATFGLFIALLLGASVLARDLSEGRLGFDFTRPMGNVSIWAGRMSAAVLLALGGAIVAVLPATISGGGVLRIFDADGVEQKTIELPMKGTAVLGAEPSPGRLLAAVFSGRRGSDRSWTLFEIDESTGAVRPVAKHLHPLELHWWFSRAQLPVGKAARLAVASNGSLVKLNLANGKKTVLIHGSHK